MTKVVMVLHGGPDDRAARRVSLVDQVSPQLLALGADRLTVTVADEAADVPGPNPFVTKGLPVALVSLWTDASADPLVACVTGAGFTVAAYEVDETVPTTYGDNRHAAPRDWPDGVRSRGVTAVSLIEQHPTLSYDEWLRRWHGRMSPVSERIQPRTRYVRNRVLRALTPDAPPWAAIVEECWPSPKHVSNPFLFYGASNPVTMVFNSLQILAAVTAFTRIWRVRTFMASEWFIRS
jgi:hypothetical protein